MMADSLVQLEFAKVIDLVVGKTQTPYGRALAAKLAPFAERSLVEEALQEAWEARQLILEDGPLPLGSGIDLLPHLERLQVEVCPRLKSFAQQLTPFPQLAAEIRHSIGPRAEILDSASFELAELRHNLKAERNRVKRQLERLLQDEGLQGVFQESLVTDRNGRYVLPVRADHSGRLKGFVHDVSASGQTLYVEPAITLESNNRVQTLLHRIEREVERILVSLTARVRDVRQPLVDNQGVLARLDLRQAVARLTIEMDAVVPELVDEPCLALHDARHPLLVVAGRQQENALAVANLDV